MSRITVQFTRRREDTPAPMIDVAAAWVVEIGMPAPDAPKMAVVAPIFADNPLALAEPGDLQAHRVDDRPAAPVRPEGDHAGGREDHPRRRR